MNADLDPARTWQHGGQPDRFIDDTVLADKTARFFDLSRRLDLTREEERTLLDLGVDAIDRLRDTPVPWTADRAKLLRRLDYALPLLLRMLATSEGELRGGL